MLEGLVKAPALATAGSVRVALSFDAWSKAEVSPATAEIPIVAVNVTESDRLRATLVGHSRPVTRLWFSPDGTVLAANDGQQVKFWNVPGQSEWFTLPHGFVQVFLTAFTPDGRCFAAVGQPPVVDRHAPVLGTELRVWDLATQKLVRTVRAAAPRRVFQFAFIPNGKEVAVMESWKDGKTEYSLQNQIVIRDLASGNARLTLKPEEAPGRMAISPHGKLLAYGAGEVHVVELATGRERALLKPVGQGDVDGMAFSTDGHMLIGVDMLGTVTVWDTGSWRVKQRLDHEKNEIFRAFALSPDGRKLATAVTIGRGRTEPKGVAIWDMATGMRSALLGHKGNVTSVAFSPDGRTLASGGTDNAIMLWEP